MGVDTGVPTIPNKNTSKINGLQASESRSRLINNAIHTEFFGGGKWERVVSPDGVVTDVTRLIGAPIARGHLNVAPSHSAKGRHPLGV
jgi:hypothetical protein